MSAEPSLLELKAQAMEAIDLLSATMDQLAEIAKSVPDADAKRAQLKEISRSIQQLEHKKIPVPDELCQLRTSIVSELAPLNEARLAILEVNESLGEMMRRLGELGLTSAAGGKPKRRSRRSSSQTPLESALRGLIIKALRSHGGRATRRQVLDWIEKRFEGQFTAREVEIYASGGMVWWSRASVERANMVREGILRSDSPIGIWELADKDS